MLKLIPIPEVTMIDNDRLQRILKDKYGSYPFEIDEADVDFFEALSAAGIPDCEDIADLLLNNNSIKVSIA